MCENGFKELSQSGFEPSEYTLQCGHSLSHLLTHASNSNAATVHRLRSGRAVH